MTAATLTEYQSFIPGVKMGVASVAHASTSKFGLGYCEGVVLCANGDNDVILGASTSSGTATVSMIDDAGSAVYTAADANYIAWGRL